ncbi:MAG: PAS domain S-box protein [Acidobacteriota bacterium]|nr:PAS domain S-box protein [Acidobacteriota bacterium]
MLMLSPTQVIPGYYSAPMVLFSIVVAVYAAYATLDLAERVSASRGLAQLGWLTWGSLSMGMGIWTMHYVGMEAYHLAIPVYFDWLQMGLSLVPAAVASAITLALVARRNISRLAMVMGSIVLGGGIASMHYSGMAAMRMKAMCVYSPRIVAASIAVSIFSSFLAIALIRRFRRKSGQGPAVKFTSAVLLGLTIPWMHYVGMASMHFEAMDHFHGSMQRAMPVRLFDLMLIVTCAAILLTASILMATVHRHLSAQTRQITESKRQLQAVFNNMSEGVLVLDPSARVVTLNPMAERTIGIAVGDVLPEYCIRRYDVYTVDGTLLRPHELPATRALELKTCVREELYFHDRTTGVMTSREVTATPILGDRGTLERILVSFRETTEPRRLDQERQRLAAIVESSDDAIIGKDTTGIITSWNRGAEKIFGYSASEMVGESIRRLLPPSRMDEEEDILQKILQNQTVEHFSTVRRTKDGREIDVSLTISPIRDARGKVIGASKIARDITATKSLEQQLLQSQKLEAIGQLTGGIAHDFNNLLGVILGNLDLLDRMVADLPDVHKRIETAQKAANRGADLTRRLLAFASKQDLKPTATSLEAATRNMLELAARALGPEIEVTTHFAPNLPMVFVDEPRLESALLNLVVNARDAMPDGGHLSIVTHQRSLDDSFSAVRARRLEPGNYAVISVSDTGTGMPPEVVERAFEPFYTTKPRGKGTGLGLPMVYGFAKQSGGHVTLYSEVGHGTILSLYLPIRDFKSSGTRRAYQDSAPAPLDAKVLLVDDERDLLEVGAEYLRSAGLTVLTAQGGEAAVAVLAAHPHIDLLVTDIIMPGSLNGARLAERARQVHPEIAIIFCSGFSADVLAEKYATINDAPLLMKPYLRKDLCSTALQALAGRAAANDVSTVTANGPNAMS